MSEMFDIVDEEDCVIGQAPRSECHGNPALVHRVAHVLVFNRSVGGHLDPGEDYKQAAIREMREEVGLTDLPVTFLYKSQIRNDIESENVATYLVVSDEEIFFDPTEMSEVRYWSPDEINAQLGRGLFTPNFEQEWQMYLDWERRYPATAQDKIAFCSGDTFPDLRQEISVESD